MNKLLVKKIIQLAQILDTEFSMQKTCNTLNFRLTIPSDQDIINIYHQECCASRCLLMKQRIVIKGLAETLRNK